MKNYAYTAKDMFGKTVRGVFQAEGAAELLAKISDKKLYCVSYYEAGSADIGPKYRFGLKELAVFCRQLSAMLNSGLTLVKALSILHKEQPNRRARQSLLELYEEVQKGRALSETMQAQNGAFPPFLISMVGAGESGGTLDAVMRRMSDHYAKESRLSNKIRSAMTYPIILMVLSLVVIIGMFTFIMPTFVDMFQGSEVPALTQFMLDVSGFIRGRWPLLLLVCAGIACIVYLALKIPSVRLFWDRLKIRVPVFGPLVVKVYTGRFARTLSSLYSSGIPMIECLEKSSAVLGNAYISDRFERVIDDVKRGDALSDAITRTGIFEPMFCSVIYVGEEAGSLDEILIKTSEYYEDESDSAIQRMVAMVEPVMIIVLGLVIGLIIASILPSMYAMYQVIE